MEERRTLAGFALSAGLFVLAWPGPRPALRPCENPKEAAARDGQTTEVVCVAATEQGAEVRGPARRLFGLPIDLGCAQAQTLETFAGIGPVLARRIVEERQVRPFDRVEDLTRVRGIGPKTLARLRGELTVASATAQSASAEQPGSLGCETADHEAQRDREARRRRALAGSSAIPEASPAEIGSERLPSTPRGAIESGR